MSQYPGMRVRGAAAGPYGPNNPPPPPPGPPPQGPPPQNSQNQRFAPECPSQPGAKRDRSRLAKDQRKRAYEQRQFEERVRSRSPAYSQDRGGPARYRQRTTPRREQVQETVPSAPAQQEQRRPPTIQSGVCFICDEPGHEVLNCPRKTVKCFSCNEWGHTKRNCKGPAGGLGNTLIACYRCGEVGHVARQCTAVAGRPTMSDTYTAPVQSKSTEVDYSRYEATAESIKNIKTIPRHEKVATWDAGGDDWLPEREASNDREPGQNSRYQDNSSQNWRSYEDGSGQPAVGAPRVDYGIEDEVDWDDDALQAGESAAPFQGSTGPNPHRPPTPATSQDRAREAQIHQQRQREIERQRTQKAIAKNWLAKSRDVHTLPPKPQQNSQPPPNVPPRNLPKTADSWPPQQEYVQPQQNSQPTPNVPPRNLPQNADRWPPQQEYVQPRPPFPTSRTAFAVSAPPTAYDLRGYSIHVAREMADRPEMVNFSNNPEAGKVSPHLYGSDLFQDLGLCYQAFLCRRRCNMGLDCPWRHHPLSNTERAWIIQHGGERGKEFIEKADQFWAYPDMPLPGASLEGKGGWEFSGVPR